MFVRVNIQKINNKKSKADNYFLHMEYRYVKGFG